MEGRIEAGLIIDKALGSGDGGFFFYEVGKIEFEVGRFRLEALLEGTENGGDTLHMDEAAVFLEDLDKTAHVGAFKLVGKIDGKGDGGDGVLGCMGPIPDDDGVAEAFDPDFVDPQVTEIRGSLSILKGVGLGVHIFQSIPILNESSFRAKGKDFDL